MVFNSLPKDWAGARRPRIFFIVLIFFCSMAGVGECAQLFYTQFLPVEGATLSAAPADLDGKGAAEIIVVHKTGVYPGEKRWISIFYADSAGQYAGAPRQKWEVDPAAAMYDVGDVAAAPGKEIFYLTGHGVRYYARETGGDFSTSPRTLLSIPTITPFPEQGALPRVRLLADWKGNGDDMLLLPQFGALMFFSRSGSAEWRRTDKIELSPRAFLYSDRVDDGTFRDFSFHSVVQIPRIFVKDFDGDNLPDLLLTNRETLFVYKPYPPQPDQTIIVEGITSGVNLEDVNGDGREDMYLSSVRVGFWKIVKNLLSKRADVETAVFLLQSDNRYSKKPDYEKETSYRLNLTRGVKFRGAFPTLEGDFNGDGEKDLLIARDEKIEIHARNSNGDFFLKPVSQSNVFTSVYRHITDLNGDGRDDLIFYEKKRGGRISVSLNRMQPSME